MQRYFVGDIKNLFKLPSDIYKHAIVVLRMKLGARFELVDNKKNIYLMELNKLENNEAYAKIIKRIDNDVELPVEVTLVCGLPKGDKVDFIVQKSCELGASRIIFFKSDYSVARWDKKKQLKKIERLKKIAQSACEQSHRLTIPVVSYIESLHDLDIKNTLKVVAYEEAAKQGEKTGLKEVFGKLGNTEKKLVAVFGAEGGLSKKEITFLNSKNFISVGLGPRIMRTETAPLYLLSALSYYLELM